jgi:hypothetical protein
MIVIRVIESITVMRNQYCGNVACHVCNELLCIPVMLPWTRPAANDARLALAAKQVPAAVNAELDQLRRANVVLQKEAAQLKEERAEYIEKSNEVHTLLKDRIDALELELVNFREEAAEASDDGLDDFISGHTSDGILPDLGEPGATVPAKQVVLTDGSEMEL